MQKQREAQPRPLETINPGIPRPLVTLVSRLMAKNPRQRPQSAGAVEAELRRYQGGETVLPLDRPEDLAFLEEVARLEAVSATDDDDIPVASSSAGLAPDDDIPPPPDGPGIPFWALVLAGGGVLVGVILAVVLIKSILG
jgi:hypothetical protein